MVLNRKPIIRAINKPTLILGLAPTVFQSLVVASFGCAALTVIFVGFLRHSFNIFTLFYSFIITVLFAAGSYAIAKWVTHMDLGYLKFVLFKFRHGTSLTPR